MIHGLDDGVHTREGVVHVQRRVHGARRGQVHPLVEAKRDRPSHRRRVFGKVIERERRQAKERSARDIPGGIDPETGLAFVTPSSALRSDADIARDDVAPFQSGRMIGARSGVFLQRAPIVRIDEQVNPLQDLPVEEIVGRLNGYGTAVQQQHSKRHECQRCERSFDDSDQRQALRSGTCRESADSRSSLSRRKWSPVRSTSGARELSRAFRQTPGISVDYLR